MNVLASRDPVLEKLMIGSDQLLTALVKAAFPTFAVLIGILINNQCLNDFAGSMDSHSGSINQRFDETNRRIEHLREMVTIDIRRVEQTLDIRLRHLEKHLHR